VQCSFTEVDEDCCAFINKLFVDFNAANWYSAVECSAVGFNLKLSRVVQDRVGGGGIASGMIQAIQPNSAI
jgi:hypothetical protein